MPTAPLRWHPEVTLPHRLHSSFCWTTTFRRCLLSYDKTAFRIDFTLNGQTDNYEGRQDFGDGEGSLVQHIQNYHEYYAKDENWKNFVLHNKGPEAWEQDKAEREMVLTEFIPYLKQHCNLSAMEQAATAALREGQNISPEQAAYYNTVVAYVQDCRPLLNQGQYNLPEPPKLADFDQSLQDYKAQVQVEIAQEAAAAGMTVEEYAADRKSTRLNSSHRHTSRMPSSA